MEIKFENFKLIRNESTLLDNINLIIKNNKYNLEGVNGVGKTSLLNFLYKIENDYKGDVYINNVNIKKISKIKLRKEYITYINQKFMFFEYLTIKENVLIIVKKKNLQKKIFKEMQCEFNVCKNMHIRQLSGGQKQYLNILLSIFDCNKILLIDEPFNNLSENRVKKVKEFISELDVLVIMVSHKDKSYKTIKITGKKLECKD